MENIADGAKLILICGLPGTGKTSLAKQLEQQHKAVRFSADDWMDALAVSPYDEVMRDRVERLQWRLGRRLLSLGLTVIIEWGTWGRAERDALRVEARSLGASVDLYYLSAPLETLFARIQQRGAEDPPIERSALARWAKQFEAPTAEEMALFNIVRTSADLEHASAATGGMFRQVY
jgi:predicted kinase